MPGLNANPLDIAVATVLNTNLKACATLSTKSAMECTTPQLRSTFTEMAKDDVERQGRIATLMSQKGIYVAPPVSDTTVNQIIPQLQAIMTGVSAGAPGVAGATTGNVAAPRIL